MPDTVPFALGFDIGNAKRKLYSPARGPSNAKRKPYTCYRLVPDY